MWLLIKGDYWTPHGKLEDLKQCNYELRTWISPWIIHDFQSLRFYIGMVNPTFYVSWQCWKCFRCLRTCEITLHHNEMVFWHCPIFFPISPYLLGSVAPNLLESMAWSLWTSVKQMKKPPKDNFLLLCIGPIFRSHSSLYGFKHSSQKMQGCILFCRTQWYVPWCHSSKQTHYFFPIRISYNNFLQNSWDMSSSSTLWVFSCINKYHIKQSKGSQQHNLSFKG